VVPVALFCVFEFQEFGEAGKLGSSEKEETKSSFEIDETHDHFENLKLGSMASPLLQDLSPVGAHNLLPATNCVQYLNLLI
jgi:hypothetical protein